ncbi:hypothetical protein [Thermogemmata fonticola]|jgi:hypothetical protein|uniref:Uncharacterized protein n=1 Tax=Thermogemmata fonticola TaxID=2755323 RepID=A0A7V8VFQ5_9BACT|nr:hypothetical protein [Thermogemmata fonticola]MBA2226977.1 hypothetical protein [Thermogemmata fonticola]
MSAPAPVMQPCPGCGMPRLADAIGRSPCPVCADMAPSAPEAPAPREAPAADPYAHLPADASVLYAAASPPPDKAARTPWRLLGLAFAAGALLGGLTVAAFRPASSPEPPADAFVSPIVALAERSPPASPVVSDPPAGKTADSAEKTPSAPPASPEAPVGKPGEEPGGQAAAKPPAPGQPEKPDPPGADKPGADRPGADRPVANQPEPEKPRPLPPPPLQRERIVVRLEQPEATYTVPEEWLQPGRSIVLRGQVRELRIPHLPPHTELDARELTAGSIYVGGERLEMVQMHLHAPEGVVAFRTVVGQGAKLHVDAPGGMVRFALANPWQQLPVLIHRGAQVHIRARQLRVDGAIRDPQTQLRIDCTGSARLWIEAVQQGAQVLYRSATENKKARIDARAATVDPSATFRRSED